MKENTVNIIGSGFAGISAAITLAEKGYFVTIVSQMRGQRAQSMMSEGGINAVLDNKDDSVKYHLQDTLKAGCYLANEKAVERLAEDAPGIIEWLCSLGVSLARDKKGELLQRSMAGQSRKRSVYADSCIGRQVMSGLLQKVRQYEAEGFITTLNHHSFEKLILDQKECKGCLIRDDRDKKIRELCGSVIIASGGMNGLFGTATGSLLNTGEVTAALFEAGVELANLEMIQFHPTTYLRKNKRVLISEAVRGEGGRLFAIRNNKSWYFMEEKYPEFGNLMPRDVISREIFKICKDLNTSHVFLDMTEISKNVLDDRLSDTVSNIKEYMNLNPEREPIPIYPGIHYFMGGIRVDENHRTNVKNLYAAGECACQYHGANRLGGNSIIGALHGGKTAAQMILSEKTDNNIDQEMCSRICAEYEEFLNHYSEKKRKFSYDSVKQKQRNILNDAMGIYRKEEELTDAFNQLVKISQSAENGYDSSYGSSEQYHLLLQIQLAKAIIMCALERKESRGSHQRSDYPELDDTNYKKTTVVYKNVGKITVDFMDI